MRMRGYEHSAGLVHGRHSQITGFDGGSIDMSVWVCPNYSKIIKLYSRLGRPLSLGLCPDPACYDDRHRSLRLAMAVRGVRELRGWDDRRWMGTRTDNEIRLPAG